MLKFPILDNILIVNILKFQTYFFCEMEEATQPSSIGPTISLSESDETDHEEDENANTAGQEPPKKKLRVTAAAVHLEFEQQKDNKGVWNSKCKHCSVKETVYKHKNCSALLVHLDRKHPAIHKKCLEEDLKERKERGNTMMGREHQVKIGASSKGH